MLGDDTATLADDERLFDEATSGGEPETEPELDPSETATEPPQGGAEPDPEPPRPGAPQPTEPHPAPPEHVLRYVPLSEHLDQRDKMRQRAEAAERRAQETERLLKEIYAKQQAEAQPAPEIWDKPDEFVRRQIEPLLSPLQQALQQMQQQQQQRELERSHESAVKEFGEDLVGKAYAAMEEAVERQHDPEARAAHLRIMSSYHPWRGVVDWYKRSKVARDPDDLLKDPEFVKRAVASYNAQAAANPVTHQPGAAASLPSVSRVGTPAVPEDDVDLYDKLSDEEAYEYVLRDERGRFTKGRS